MYLPKSATSHLGRSCWIVLLELTLDLRPHPKPSSFLPSLSTPHPPSSQATQGACSELGILVAGPPLLNKVLNRVQYVAVTELKD
jgi:hypothetical protein